MIVGVACEDEGHFSATTHIIDTTLLAAHPWLDGIIESCRSWRGLDESEPWYKYSPRDAHDLRPITLGNGQVVKPHGRINGRPLEPEASMWRKVLLLFSHCTPTPEVVLLVRDMDGYGERERGMRQVEVLRWPFDVVIAAPQPEIESWYVSGFVPANDDERAALKDRSHQISFDPTRQSHRLTSHPNDKPTDAKRVLAALCGDDRERRQRCLDDLGLLRERGSLNGAATFPNEVEQTLVPLVAPVTP